jgi:ankyrin repeat protein
VRALLDGGADPDIRNDKMEQARQLAVAAGRDDLVELLESHHAPGKRLFGLF